NRAQTLSFRRRSLERPRELRQRPPSRPADDVIAREQSLNLVPEWARLARASLVGGRLAHEVQAMRCTRARCVEGVAVSRDAVRSRQSRARACVELAPRVVAEEGRLVTATRQASFLEP